MTDTKPAGEPAWPIDKILARFAEVGGPNWRNDTVARLDRFIDGPYAGQDPNTQTRDPSRFKSQR